MRRVTRCSTEQCWDSVEVEERPQEKQQIRSKTFMLYRVRYREGSLSMVR